MKWSKNKIAKIYEYYKLNLDFQLIEDFNIVKYKEYDEAANFFLINAISHNSNLSARKIVNLLSESELEIIAGKVQLQEL